MSLFHNSFEAHREIMRRLDGFADAFDGIQTILERLMIDTSKLLAAVSQENTTVNSLIALVQSNTAAQKSVSDQLTAANATIATLQAQIAAGGDPALKAQVADLQTQMTTAQADLDKATSDLSAESAKAQAALTNGVPNPTPTVPANPPPTVTATSS